MWKLYDDLYIGIPSGIRIESCVIGERWTTVRANGNIGIARTLNSPGDPSVDASQFTGQYLRDVACHLRWDILAKASVGVAAMNAWYNTAERVQALERSPKLQAQAGKTAYVGDYIGEDIFPMPLESEFDISKYERLAEYDQVVIASEAIITRALPKLLDIIGDGGNVILEGYCLPATTLFFSFGLPVRELRGYYQKYMDTVEACALKNIADPTPGVSPFSIRPMKVKKIHESETAEAIMESTYNSTKFNNNFSC